MGILTGLFKSVARVRYWLLLPVTKRVALPFTSAQAVSPLTTPVNCAARVNVPSVLPL